MTSHPAKSAEFTRRVQDFALAHVMPRRTELISAKIFPDDLWQQFAASGLAGLSVPEEFGGANASFETLSAAGRNLNRYGGVPGVTLVFQSHWLMSKLHIVGDARRAMKNQLLPLLARGTTTLSVAISEPGAGAHPKHLKTAARREGEHFIIDGEKAFLTNGPIADHFIVLAVTGETDGRKAFSAILVPADSDGFQRTAGVEIDFLHPSPHGGIALTACRVPVSNLIGEEGAAFERTSLRMRVFEDAVGAAAHVGAMACLLADIAALASSDMAGDIGVVATQLRALDVTAERLAAMVDHDDYQAIMELQLGFRLQSGHCMTALERLLQKSRGPYTSMTTLLARDVGKLHTIAQAAHTARTAKIGLALLKDQSGI